MSTVVNEIAVNSIINELVHFQYKLLEFLLIFYGIYSI